MKSVCVLGDSVAKGVVYDEKKEKYIFSKESFIKLLEKRGEIKFKNLAKFGCTVLKGKEILAKNQGILHEYDYALLEFGGNDCDLNWVDIAKNPQGQHFANVPMDSFKSNYAQLIETVEKSGCKPVLMTLPPLYSKYFFNWISKDLSKENILKYLKYDIENISKWHESYNQAVKDLAKKYAIPLLDITSAFNNLKDISSYLCIDGMHPNEKGHKLIAGKISF